MSVVRLRRAVEPAQRSSTSSPRASSPSATATATPTTRAVATELDQAERASSPRRTAPLDRARRDDCSTRSAAARVPLGAPRDRPTGRCRRARTRRSRACGRSRPARPCRISRSEKRAALLRRHERVEVELGLHRVGLGGELEPARQPPDVRVDRQAREVERDRAHDVAGLAPDARAASPGPRARSGTSPSNSLLERCGHAEQALRLRAEEAGRVDERLDARRGRRRRGRPASGSARTAPA